MNRLFRHAILGAVGSVIVLAVSIIQDGEPAVHRASMGTAYAALVFLCAALSLGPWYALTSGRRPASTPLRRDIAIWSALFGLTHIVFGLQVHFGGHWLNYFLHLDSGAVAVRTDAFGAANHVGLIAGVGLLVLLTISNDAAMRWLGLARWRLWQSAAPWIGAATLVHAAVYQALERRALLFVALTVALSTVVVALRAARARASGRPRD